MKRVLWLHGSDGCTTMRMYIMPLNCLFVYFTIILKITKKKKKHEEVIRCWIYFEGIDHEIG